MPLKITSRDDWGAQAAESITFWDPAKLDGVVVHWFGVPSAAKSHTGCPALLRGVQNAHQAGEFSDIAYNHGVCPHGEIYELRGFLRKTGANGTGGANSKYAAIVYMAGVGDTPTAQGLGSLSRIIQEWWVKGAGRKVLPHGFITGSACPGPDLTQWIAKGGYKQGANPVDPTKRKATLQSWILARRAAGWSWSRIKATRNWTEFKKLGGV